MGVHNCTDCKSAEEPDLVFSAALGLELDHEIECHCLAGYR